MKVGDLVRITDAEPEDTRGLGTVLCFDTYKSQGSYSAHSDLHHHHELPTERIAEVLWSDAHIGWILGKRLVVINESR